MKKMPMISRIYLALILSTFATSVVADNCCPSICNLFDCSNWAYQTRIGIYPTIWSDRGHVFLNSCDGVNFAPFDGTDLGELPKFSKFYKLPWIVGTQVQYLWCDCLSVYGELNYFQASHKKTPQNTITAVNPALAITLGTYRALSGYVGLIYNFGDWCFCDNITFFVGAKIGFVYRQNIHAHTVAVLPTPVPACPCSIFKRDFFTHAAKISGGANIGFNYGWCDRWSVIFTAEVVASGGPKGAFCVPLTDTEISQLAGGSYLGVQRIKNEISFPITLGLKYNF